jgi:hypothetical protein
VPILARDTRHAIGHVGLGNMKLFELFSRNPEAEQKPEEEINWLDDLKFFIDNNDDLLTQQIFPAVARHKQHKDSDSAYKVYVKPLRQCAIKYCDKFETEKPHKELFPTSAIVKLARHLADQQGSFIEKGDYQ